MIARISQRISAADLGQRLAEVLRQVKENHESFVIERDGEVIAEIGPPPVSPVSWRNLLDALPEYGSGDITFGDDLELLRHQRPLIGTGEIT